MRLDERARSFVAGGVEITDRGSLALEPGEQVTLTTPGGGEWDVVRREWGFYATPSLNARLPEHGLRPLLASNAADRLYLLLVERGREEELERYLAEQDMSIVRWLDQA